MTSSSLSCARKIGHDRWIAGNREGPRLEDAIVQIALVGPHRRAVLQLHEAAVDAFERRRVDRAVGAVTAAAAALAEQCLALLRQRSVHSLIGQPARIIGGLHDIDFADHMRVLCATVLGAFDLVSAGVGRFEPHRFVSAGQDIVLDPECRNKEAVDHVLRGQHQPDGLVDRHMQRIDLALAARVLDLPHPLLADDKDFEITGRRLVKPDIDHRTPDEEHQKRDQGRNRPADFKDPALLRRVGARGAAAAPIAQAEHQHQPADQQQDQTGDDKLGNIERVDHLAVDGSGVRPERDPLVHRRLNRDAVARSRRRRRCRPPSPPG